MLILDTHTHIYSEDEASYPPVVKPLRPPGDAGSVANLERVTKASGVAGVCIVQPSTFYGWDNRFICDTAVKTQRWTAGVCTLDPDDPHSPDSFSTMSRSTVFAHCAAFPREITKSTAPVSWLYGGHASSRASS
jgi:predicted TIM-barrel fold metal-dependent hydrolase